jgi:hypothetical protein
MPFDPERFAIPAFEQVASRYRPQRSIRRG